MMRRSQASVRSSRRHSCWHSVRGSPSENIRKAGLFGARRSAARAGASRLDARTVER
jgi:hypothetical protein